MVATYQVGGRMQWAALSGQAIIALQNFSGSGRKVTVREVRVDVLSSMSGVAGSITRGNALVTLVRGSPGGEGNILSFSSHDTDSPALPAEIVASTLGGVTSPTTLWRGYLNRCFTGGGLNDFCQMTQRGKHSWTIGKARPSVAALESYVLNEGETLALTAVDDRSTIPLEVSAQIQVGTATYQVRGYVWSLNAGAAIISITNGTGSGEVVIVRSISVNECGSTDTPYIQLVPIGSIDPAALVPANRLTPIPSDTATPVLDTSKTAAFENVALLPLGVPQQYIAEASTGTPRGYNYLHTKDFVGPQWRVYFPELRVGSAGVIPDGLGFLTRPMNLLGRGPGGAITLRPGEGVAVVSSAENATGTFLGLSAWTSLDIWITFTEEPLINPSVTLTGLQAGTVVAVVEAGTETLIELLTEVGGEVTYEYDADPGTFVDFNMLAAGFVWQQLANFDLIEDVQSIPITQVVDVVYDGVLTEAVTFNGTTKLIVADTGNTSIDVQALYTEWVDWALLGNNLRFFPAFETQGGTDIDVGAGTSIPFYVYLINGWRVRPQEANSTLTITTGVLLVDGGGDPFVNTLGAFTVRILYQQPVQAITVNTAGTVAPSQQEIRDAMTLAPLDVPVAGSIDTLISEVPAELATRIVEGTITWEQVMRAVLTSPAAKATVPAGAGSFAFRDQADTKDRIAGTVDGSGNRVITTLDLT